MRWRNGKWRWIFVQEEKRSQSGEDQEESTQKKKKIKNLNKVPSAAVAASEEMVPHLNIIWSLKCPLTSQPILLQKIVDEQKVMARLEEEVKKLKAQIEQSESVPE